MFDTNRVMSQYTVEDRLYLGHGHTNVDLFLNAHFYVRLGGFTHTQTEISAAEKHLFVNAYLSEGFPKYPIQWICLGWINGAAVNAMTLFVSVRACVSAQRVCLSHTGERESQSQHTHTLPLSLALK